MVYTSFRRSESNMIVLPRSSSYLAGSLSAGGATSGLRSIILSVAAIITLICVIVASNPIFMSLLLLLLVVLSGKLIGSDKLIKC